MMQSGMAPQPQPQAQPQQGMGGQGGLNPQILQMLMQMIEMMATTAPNQKAVNPPRNLPAMGIPESARTATPDEMQLNQLLSLIQQGMPGQGMMNGLQGARGGPSGVMGGRPPGT